MNWKNAGTSNESSRALPNQFVSARLIFWFYLAVYYFYPIGWKILKRFAEQWLSVPVQWMPKNNRIDLVAMGEARRRSGWEGSHSEWEIKVASRGYFFSSLFPSAKELLNNMLRFPRALSNKMKKRDIIYQLHSILNYIQSIKANKNRRAHQDLPFFCWCFVLYNEWKKNANRYFYLKKKGIFFRYVFYS